MNLKKVLLLAVLLIAGYQFVQLDDVAPRQQHDSTPAPTAGQRDGSRSVKTSRGVETLARAFESRQSNLQVEAQGIVEKVLPDDNQGSRHQRFIVRVSDRQTVLIAHNIDLASRVPGLRAGDSIEFRGEYEWSSKGGVIHWTHHDPQGRHTGGWLRHDGREYR